MGVSFRCSTVVEQAMISKQRHAPIPADIRCGVIETILYPLIEHAYLTKDVLKAPFWLCASSLKEKTTQAHQPKRRLNSTMTDGFRLVFIS